MTSSGPGRPPKPDSKKRRQLHISLYDQDMERLDDLTDNRSEFIRTCINRSWHEERDGDVTLQVTLPRWLLEALVDHLQTQIPAEEGALLGRLLRSFSVAK